MRKLKLVTCVTLLTTTPSLIVYPQDTLAHVESVGVEEEKTEGHHLESYDEIIDFINAVESGTLENRCTPADLDRINHYLAHLAQKGVLHDGSEESLSLEDDIDELLGGGNPFEYASSLRADDTYIILPALSGDTYEIILCKSWLKKAWKHTVKFIKKHKKELIIGAVVVAAAAVVVAAVVATTAGAAVAGAAGAAASGNDKKDSHDHDAEPEVAVEAPTLQAAVEEQIASFKENLVAEEFFQPPVVGSLPWEESGRVLGSLMSQDSINNITQSADPNLTREVQNIRAHYPALKNNHHTLDKQFSTDYPFLYAQSSEGDFNTRAYQARGEMALNYGYYKQAVHDFDLALVHNQSDPSLYLERGVAHFGLGDYDRSLQDYHTYTEKTQKTLPFSALEFSKGFVKGLPQGVYDSGEGLLFFMSDAVTHPIRTGGQVWESCNALAGFVRTEQWESLGAALSPEVHQLITQWDTLSSEERGRLAGYAVGKNGADICLPGAVAKVAAKGVIGAKEISVVMKNLKNAEKALMLESIAGLENTAQVQKMVQAGQRTAHLAEELGFAPHDLSQLKKAGQLEKVVNSTAESVLKDPVMRESSAFFKKAESFLESHAKKFMPENEVRKLIHETGIRTFPRPEGIPENFKVRITEKGGGMDYVHPTNTHISVRVMPGKPHSNNPSQQKPYVIQKIEGKAFDKYGNLVEQKTSEAHIPLDEFIYRD